MIQHRLELATCAVCRSRAFDVVCPAQEIAAHLEFLSRFHRRRLRPNKPAGALADRAEFTHNYATAIVACVGCGLILRNPRPAPEDIRRAYVSDEYGHKRLAAMFDSQVPLYRRKARVLSAWLPRDARVVEVGSFVGGFLAAGRERGWSMMGVDPGREVDSFCAERNLSVVGGALADVPMEAGTVDCVAIWNTFDQLPDPAATLDAARRLLRAGGVLALRVPNGACFRLAERWRGALRHAGPPFHHLSSLLLLSLAWNNLLAFPYLMGYSAPTLERLLTPYRLERLRFAPDTLCPLADAQSLVWARWEERLVKAACRLALRMNTWRPHSRLSLAPWLDAYYRAA